MKFLKTNLPITSILSIHSISIVNASLKANIESFIRANISTNSQQPALRAFTSTVANGFEPINGYGCWCFLDESWRDEQLSAINRPSIQAHGKTVDPLDEACKNLINSYKCIELDAEEQGIEDCDAQAVDYTPYNFFQGAAQGIEVNCNENNEGFCAQAACIVEGTFTMQFLQYVVGGPFDVSNHPDYNANYVHLDKGGDFDPDVECAGIANPVGSEKECCGSFLDLSRHPYRLFSGFTTRSCCAGDVINNEISQCCNGVVLGINEPC